MDSGRARRTVALVVSLLLCPVLARAQPDPGDQEPAGVEPPGAVTPEVQADRPDERGEARQEPDDGKKKSKKSKKSKKDVDVDLHGQVQLRWFAGPPWRGGTPDPEEDFYRNSFQVPRSRLQVDAEVFDWEGQIEVGFGRDNVRLLDAWARRDLPGGLRVRVGQFKRLLSQTFLISSTSQQVIERPAVADELTGIGRDIGATLSGEWLGDRVMAAVGVFNGNGHNEKADDNTDLMLEARVDVAPLGKYSLDSWPIGNKPRIRLGAGVSTYRTEELRKDNKKVVLTERDETLAWSAFGAAKAYGVEVRGEWFQGTDDPMDARPVDQRDSPLPVPSRSWRGGYLSLAVDLPKLERWQVAGVAERWTPDDTTDDGQRDTYTAALNWYLYGDQTKLQVEWERELLQDQDTELRRDTVMLQVQLLF